MLATGTPTIVVLLAGRPYALGAAVDEAAAIVQSFFPGEEGTPAIAGVLSGRVNPSGRLPVSIPARPGAQPSTYLAAPLAQKTDVSNIDPAAAFPFGHGLGYSSFAWAEGEHGPDTAETDGSVTLGLSVRNTGERSGVEVVQLYLHDPVASVVRPVRRLIGFARLELAPGEVAELSIRVPADVTSFSDRSGLRVVEPGRLELQAGRSSGDILVTRSVTLTGPTRVVGFDRELHPTFTRR